MWQTPWITDYLAELCHYSQFPPLNCFATPSDKTVQTFLCVDVRANANTNTTVANPQSISGRPLSVGSRQLANDNCCRTVVNVADSSLTNGNKIVENFGNIDIV